MNEKVYLGDSVYAEHDGLGAIQLTTENGLPNDPSNTIYLEVEVQDALLQFMGRLRGARVTFVANTGFESLDG